MKNQNKSFIPSITFTITLIISIVICVLIGPLPLASSSVNPSNEFPGIGSSDPNSDTYLRMQAYLRQLEQLLSQLPPEQQSMAIEMLEEILPPQLAQKLLPSMK